MGFRISTTDDDLMFKIVRDNRVTLKAKGLFFFIASCPYADYFTISGVSKFLKEGKDAIRSAAHELEEFEYIERVQDNF